MNNTQGMATSNLWLEITALFRMRLGKILFDSLFSTAQVTALSEKGLIISVLHLSTKNRIEKQYHSLLLEAVQAIEPSIQKLKVTLRDWSGNPKLLDSARTAQEKLLVNRSRRVTSLSAAIKMEVGKYYGINGKRGLSRRTEENKIPWTIALRLSLMLCTTHTPSLIRLAFHVNAADAATYLLELEMEMVTEPITKQRFTELVQILTAHQINKV